MRSILSFLQFKSITSRIISVCLLLASYTVTFPELPTILAAVIAVTP